MKPAASIAAPIAEPSSKSGTTIVKTPPPKETARITVKPNLPVAAVRPGNFAAKPAVGAVPVAAAAGAVAGAAAVKAVAPKPATPAKPATTIVKPGTAKVVGAPKPVAAATPAAAKAASAPAPVVTSTTQFQEEGSTTLTTALAGALALLTWGTATVLVLNLYGVL